MEEVGSPANMHYLSVLQDSPDSMDFGHLLPRVRVCN